MSDKALNSATLELTQRIQMHFPREIDTSILRVWNGTSANVISARLLEVFGQVPEPPTPPKPDSLLAFVGATTISATTSKFVATDRFTKDTGRKAKVRISYIGDNFTEWFLEGNGKTEEPIGESNLYYHKLLRGSVDAPIIAELGGEAKVETTLTEVFALMEKQSKGEAGVLLNNGWANIFYIRDMTGVLRVVPVYWRDGGWNVSAYSVEYPLRWDGGAQAFSRNSVL